MTNEKSVKLTHLKTLTDEKGVLQFARCRLPDPASGYTTDDNARALVAMTMHYSLHKDNEALDLAGRYLSLLRHVQREDGQFHNFLDHNLHPLDEIGSEDCFGQTIWALGSVLNSTLPQKLLSDAKNLLEKALKHLNKLQHARPKAFSLIGLHQAAQVLGKECISLHGLARKLANDLYNLYLERSEQNWRWFEDTMTYANGALCEGLLRAYNLTGERRYLVVGLEALQFLNEVCTKTSSDCPSPDSCKLPFISLIGNNGWFPKGGIKAEFDQQPIDAMWLFWANCSAWLITDDWQFQAMAKLSLDWFTGHNVLGIPVYEPHTGACRDGLGQYGASENCGAESTICALLTFLRAEENLFSLDLQKEKTWRNQ